MAIKTRNELGKLFQNGILPTAQDFVDLLDSTLNRKEDRFFGLWKAGIFYCNGDVVLHEGSLFVLDSPTPDNGNAGLANQAVQENPCKDEEPTTARNCICSVTPPDKDDRWKPLVIKVQDDDWVLETRKKDNDVMYSNETVQSIGIGTKEPKAKLDINIVDKGAFLFQPLEEEEQNAPVFILRAKSDTGNASDLKQSVAQADASWHTNAYGFVFRQKPLIGSQEAEARESCAGDDPELLMRLTAYQGKPAVGIGTPLPEAALHARVENAGEIKLDPGRPGGPCLHINSLGGQQNYFQTDVEDDATVIRTKEGSSIFFRHVEIQDDKDPCNDERPAVAISPEGKVGIGTEKPASHLDIIDKVDEKGRFRMSFEKANPAFAILNTRPREESNYMTLGVDNNRGVIITDSPHGIEIKTGSPCINNNRDNEVNINQDGSDTLMSIFPDARVGIGKHPEGPYSLDVKGDLVALGLFLPADARDMKDAEPLHGEQALADLKRLEPIKFNWKNHSYRYADRKNEIGLRAAQVDEFIPQVVQSNRGQPESIAYQNLVPVLIAAVNRLAQRIDELEKGRSKS